MLRFSGFYEDSTRIENERRLCTPAQLVDAAGGRPSLSGRNPNEVLVESQLDSQKLLVELRRSRRERAASAASRALLGSWSGFEIIF